MKTKSSNPEKIEMSLAAIIGFVMLLVAIGREDTRFAVAAVAIMSFALVWHILCYFSEKKSDKNETESTAKKLNNKFVIVIFIAAGIVGGAGVIIGASTLTSIALMVGAIAATANCIMLFLAVQHVVFGNSEGR